jgi:hypothetical protein
MLSVTRDELVAEKLLSRRGRQGECTGSAEKQLAVDVHVRQDQHSSELVLLIKMVCSKDWDCHE